MLWKVLFLVSKALGSFILLELETGTEKETKSFFDLLERIIYIALDYVTGKLSENHA